MTSDDEYYRGNVETTKYLVSSLTEIGDDGDVRVLVEKRRDGEKIFENVEEVLRKFESVIFYADVLVDFDENVEASKIRKIVEISKTTKLTSASFAVAFPEITSTTTEKIVVENLRLNLDAIANFFNFVDASPGLREIDVRRVGYMLGDGYDDECDENCAKFFDAELKRIATERSDLRVVYRYEDLSKRYRICRVVPLPSDVVGDLRRRVDEIVDLAQKRLDPNRNVDL